MGDQYGALALPVPAPATGAALSDPALDTLLAFFKAALEDHAAPAWALRAPADPIVKDVFRHNPDGPFGLREAALPSLFLHRSAVGRAVDEASDFRVRTSTLLLSWVFPPSPQEKQLLREEMLNGIGAVIDAAIEIGRTPSWTVATDTNPASPTYDDRATYDGSLLYRHVAIYELKMLGATRRPLVVRTPQPMQYHRVEMTLELRERLERDLSAHYDEADVDGVDLTATTAHETGSTELTTGHVFLTKN